ncbi:ABC transporter substrate-binding protein [Trueperella sp. LYQ143]|uniref:ABC transporter substrate-binding protein n=1 Tax=unclassified Trueperella TaxID=2630174 RepID=UPI003983A958
MKISTKRLVAAGAALATCFGLAACSNPAADPGAGGADPSEAGYWPEPTAKLDGVELDLWVAQNSNKVPLKVVADFEEKTGAKINVTTIPDPYEQNIQTKVTTGDTPDLAFWQPTQSMLSGFIAQNKLQKLDNAPWVDNYTPGIADSGGVVNGTRYAAIISTPPVMGVFYNKKVFEAAGITKTPGSWNEFVQTAEKIRDAKVPGVESPLFEMGGSRWGTQYAVQIQLAEAARDGLWDRVNKAEEKFSDATIQGAVNNYKALFDQGLYNSNAGSAKDIDEATALWEGRTGMIVCVNSLFNQIAAMAHNDKAALDEKIGFFPLSAQGTIGTVIPEQNNSVVAFKTGDEQREAAARQFLNFWMTTDYQNFVQDQSIISVIKDVPSPATVPQALVDSAAAINNSVGSMQSLAIANPDLYINLADMINGTKTPQDVTRATQEQFANLAKAQGAEGF